MNGLHTTPEHRLHLLATTAIASSKRSPELALNKFISHVIDAPDADELIIALVTPERLNEIGLDYLREVLARDMDGGGIGLSPTSKKTGSDAVAEDAGQSGSGVQDHVARFSAPDSKTSVDKPAGGGHKNPDTQVERASPTSTKTWSPDDVYVNEYTRSKPGHAVKKPRVSMQSRLKSETQYAMTLLDTIKVRGKAIGDWTHDEAMAVAESSEMDARILRAFAVSVPPLGLIRDYITPDRAEEIMKTLETANAA